jgi:NADH dehydrogenase FAD-containing subunit
MPSGAKRPQIVIVGGGFAGIAAAKAPRHCDAEVIVIDRRNHHIFQPLLALSSGDSGPCAVGGGGADSTA